MANVFRSDGPDETMLRAGVSLIWRDAAQHARVRADCWPSTRVRGLLRRRLQRRRVKVHVFPAEARAVHFEPRLPGSLNQEPAETGGPPGGQSDLVDKKEG